MKKIIVLGLVLIVLLSFVTATYYSVGECMVYDDETNTIVSPVHVNLNDRGVYKYFKPEVVSRLPQPKEYFTLETNVALWTGVSYDSLKECNN